MKKWKNKNTKGGFQCLYAPIILIDLIYWKDKNNYRKVFLEKHYFIEDIDFFCSNCDEEYYDEESKFKALNFILKLLRNKKKV